MDAPQHERTSSTRLVRRRRVVPLVACAAIGCLVFGLWLAKVRLFKNSAKKKLAVAQKTLRDGDFLRAEQLAAAISREDPLFIKSRLLAGEAATRQNHLDDAIAYYEELPRTNSPDSLLAAFSAGEVFRLLGRLTRAEDCYEFVLKHRPDDVVAHSRLAEVRTLTGRNWEARSHLFALIQLGDWSLLELTFLADLERPIEHDDFLQQCAERAPDDLYVQFGLAVNAVMDKHLGEVEQSLRDILRRAPQLLAAHALLGEILLLDHEDRMGEWIRQLPENWKSHPDIWLARGLFDRRRGELRSAARCFWEALRLEPNHRQANYQLGQVLTALKESGAKRFLERADQLSDLAKFLDRVFHSQGKDEPAMYEVAKRLKETGRVWESWAWATTGSRTFPQSRWPADLIAECESILTPETPRTLDAARLVLAYDFADDNLAEVGNPLSLDPQKQRATEFHIHFELVPETAGLDFVYDNARDQNRLPGNRMFQQNGGGVAVLDIELDGWPDLFFSQGAPWPDGALRPVSDPSQISRWYRNQQGASFQDVTTQTTVVDDGFGQGASAGDFDNDGFADLYVANIGPNQLYQNNGDGTFSQVTVLANPENEAWTASCLLADLNADGHPDIYEANYLKGKDVFTKRCADKACSPKVFAGADDCLIISQGDGTFQRVPNATPSDEPKGLGIATIYLDSLHRPSLLISNDQVANHFLLNQQIDEWPGVHLKNEALLRGTAYNNDGIAMACMGIAVDDADGNGLPDLFVTNFRNESNTLYLQDAPGLFVDATSATGLVSPSWEKVGWGTQFLDADLDGFSDLAVVNGDVDDYRPEGGEYEMQPQFFRNTGGARFLDISPQAGPYFSTKTLGRGLSLLDWNRDGKMDFVVSNIGGPASLLTNRSHIGHFLNVRLHARRTARDAFGALATVLTGSAAISKQLNPGNGYMASNERLL
ncbi:MAG: VCBS repeat-containing protein, partial [Planctomycetaceae bacterium]|nr:VCBS repeat-containing protein [Planctomycetaceae bacterium]